MIANTISCNITLQLLNAAKFVIELHFLGHPVLCIPPLLFIITDSHALHKTRRSFLVDNNMLHRNLSPFLTPQKYGEKRVYRALLVDNSLKDPLYFVL